MSEGTVQQIGPPLEIYEDPVNRVVANFIGESNFVEATIASANGEHVSCRIGVIAELAVRLGHRPHPHGSGDGLDDDPCAEPGDLNLWCEALLSSSFFINLRAALTSRRLYLIEAPTIAGPGAGAE